MSFSVQVQIHKEMLQEIASMLEFLKCVQLLCLTFTLTIGSVMDGSDAIVMCVALFWF